MCELRLEESKYPLLEGPWMAPVLNRTIIFPAWCCFREMFLLANGDALAISPNRPEIYRLNFRQKTITRLARNLRVIGVEYVEEEDALYLRYRDKRCKIKVKLSQISLLISPELFQKAFFQSTSFKSWPSGQSSYHYSLDPINALAQIPPEGQLVDSTLTPLRPHHDVTAAGFFGGYLIRSVLSVQGKTDDWFNTIEFYRCYAE